MSLATGRPRPTRVITLPSRPVPDVSLVRRAAVSAPTGKALSENVRERVVRRGPAGILGSLRVEARQLGLAPKLLVGKPIFDLLACGATDTSSGRGHADALLGIESTTDLALPAVPSSSCLRQ